MSNKTVTEITHSLIKPIKFGEDYIKEIIISEPTYKQLKHCDLSNGQEVINTIIDKCNNLPDGLIDDLSSKDYIKLIDIISDSDFLG